MVDDGHVMNVQRPHLESTGTYDVNISSPVTIELDQWLTETATGRCDQPQILKPEP